MYYLNSQFLLLHDLLHNLFFHINQYYWTCYTIKFKKESEFKNKDISLSLKVNGKELFSTPYITSLSAELSTDRKFEINEITLEEIDHLILKKLVLKKLTIKYIFILLVIVI